VKPGDVDWGYLAQGLLLPSMTVLMSIILLATGTWYHAAQQQHHEVLSADHGAVFDDYDQLVLRKRIIDRYHWRYEQFHELGFVGRESRLDWVETLRMAAGELRLPHATYAIEPQLDVIAPVESSLGGASTEIHVSKLELELGLLHELDLLRFFDRLQEEAPGLLKVDRCKLSRQNATGPLSAADVNILASCSVEIFSVVTSDVMAQEPGR